MQILQWVKRQTGKLADNVKDYKFYVKNQPTFVDSSTTLILTPFTNRDQIATVPCTFKWSRMKNGLVSEVPEFKGNSFICQPSDIGTIIQAEVTSTDSSHPGTAVLKFGPVKLDVVIKKQIEHSLTSGNAIMNVDLIQKDQIRECQIKVTQENIKIQHNNSPNQYTFDYNFNQPRIEANIKQPTKVNIFFNQKYEADVVKFANNLFGFQDQGPTIKLSNEKKIEINFPSRALKDNFLLLIKAFNTKKAMKTSAIITKIQNANVEISQNKNFDYVLEIQSLRADLVKLARLNDKYLLDKRIYFEQAKRLQKQIQEVIETYTKIAQGRCKDQEDLNQSILGLRSKRQEIRMRSVMLNNQQLQIINQQIMINSNEQQQQNFNQQVGSSSVRPSRGGFIKKRTVPEMSSNSLAGSQVNKPQNIKMICRQLNKSVAKIAELQQQVRQMSRLNYTAMNLDQSRLSNVSKQSSKMNYTSLQMRTNQKLVAEIKELRNKNDFLKNENSQLRFKAQLSEAQIQPILDNRSQRSHALSKVQSQAPKVGANNLVLGNLNQQGNSEKQLIKKIQQLTAQNNKLKQQIQRLRIQKQVIQKEKQSLEVKYKKRVNELSSQNSMYKRNQDALNRSQNLSMEMQNYNQEQNAMLKGHVKELQEQNLRIHTQYKKALEQLKQFKKNAGQA